MKWKDSVKIADEEEQTREEFFAEERVSPWTDRKDSKVLQRINRPQVLFGLLALAIVALVTTLAMLLWGGGSDVSRHTINVLEERVLQLEVRLDKFEAIDEKVTRIWEQAKSFEKFKDRFDRGEASSSLRMDHLTMSLETLQKQMAEMRRNAVQAAAAPAAAAPISRAPVAAEVKYHEVAANETLYSISKMYELSVEDLLKMNMLSKNDVLKIGQRLIVRGAAIKN